MKRTAAVLLMVLSLTTPGAVNAADIVSLSLQNH